MSDIASLGMHHGYVLVFGIVLAEAVGLPLPAALALIAAGAASQSGTLRLPYVMLVGFLAMVLGDNLLYVAGRYTGWGFLALLCRVSLNPETCILRSAEAFYKRGKKTLLFAKFIPGINTMAPPLAGSMNMRMTQFLRLDSAGAALYVVAYSAVGYIFRDFVSAISRSVQTAAHDFEIVLLCALVAYVAYRAGIYKKNKTFSAVPRIPVAEVMRRIQGGKRDDLIIADVRSHGYYDPGSFRIEGSIRIEPNNLQEELKKLPREKEILLYCT